MIMKGTKLFTGLLLTGTALFSIVAGCKKSNNSNSSNNSSGGAGISATINGTAWQSQYVLAMNSSVFAGLTGYRGRSAGDSTWVGIQMKDTIKLNQPDTFYITSLVYFRNNQVYAGGHWTGLPKSHGQITVTSWDKTAHNIAGTFSGVIYNTNGANDSAKIDNGHFNTSYIQN